jgi:hypothetical protein
VQESVVPEQPVKTLPAASQKFRVGRPLRCYCSIVPLPIAIGTIMARAEGKYYRSTVQMKVDIGLLAQNAALFWPPEFRELAAVEKVSEYLMAIVDSDDMLNIRTFLAERAGLAGGVGQESACWGAGRSSVATRAQSLPQGGAHGGRRAAAGLRRKRRAGAAGGLMAREEDEDRSGVMSEPDALSTSDESDGGHVSGRVGDRPHRRRVSRIAASPLPPRPRRRAQRLGYRGASDDTVMDWEEQSADDRSTSPEPKALGDTISRDDDDHGTAAVAIAGTAVASTGRQTRSRAHSGSSSGPGSKRLREDNTQRIGTRSAAAAGTRGASSERQAGVHIRIKRRVQNG